MDIDEGNVGDVSTPEPVPADLPEAGRLVLSEIGSWSDSQRSDFSLLLLKCLDKSALGVLHETTDRILRMDIVASLPYELAEHVLMMLDERDLCRCEMVSKHWRSVVSETDVWKQTFRRRLRTSPDWAELHYYMPLQMKEQELAYKARIRAYLRLKSGLEENWRNNNEQHRAVQCNGQGIYCLQYDNTKIVSGSRDNTIKEWDLQGNMKRQLEGHDGSVLCLQFDNDMDRIISGSSDSTVRVWKLSTGECTHVLRDHQQSVLHLRFNKNLLVSCSKDFTVIVWTINGDVIEKRQSLVSHRAAVNVVEFDERYIVSASGDRSIKVWDTNTGALVRNLVGHQRGIACLQYRGDFVVSGSSDKFIRVWNVHTGGCLRVLSGHEELVRCVRFNENFIVSGSYDTTVRVWDFKSGFLLHTLRGHTNRVFRVQFDAYKIVSSSQDDRIMIWNFHRPDQQSLLEE
eukprot:m.36318 g.36318  ORF g.36318 m.36318 type:complete len:458 (+) comp13401_c0_seq2:746-2119(+)